MRTELPFWKQQAVVASLNDNKKKPERAVLIGVDFSGTKADITRLLIICAPGCGSPIRVVGTNGGFMPCGGELTMLGKTEKQFCSYCERDLNGAEQTRNE